MLILNYVFAVLILIALGIMYQKYLEKKALSPNMVYDNYDDVRKYLLDEHSLTESKKPILWIHVPYEYNARNWLSFGSRSSMDLNQPYLHLTVKNIIKNCDESFKICIIDDHSFGKLMPEWSVNMKTISDPILENMRQLGLAKLVHKYGGMVVPISFLCFKDLIGLYEYGINGNRMFMCENVDKNITATSNLFYPSGKFFGANKENSMLAEYIDFMQRTMSTDFTGQSKFLGEFERWCNAKINQKKIVLVEGTYLGTRTVNDEPVTEETLLSDNYIRFHGNAYGIWIPACSLLKRRTYEWFTRMSPEQIFESNFVLAKYFVLSLAPDSKMGVLEPMENQPNWIGFWKVPSGVDVWGPMPINLGNNVPRAK
jgi:hypothetical protein